MQIHVISPFTQSSKRQPWRDNHTTLDSSSLPRHISIFLKNMYLYMMGWWQDQDWKPMSDVKRRAVPLILLDLQTEYCRYARPNYAPSRSSTPFTVSMGYSASHPWKQVSWNHWDVNVIDTSVISYDCSNGCQSIKALEFSNLSDIMKLHDIMLLLVFYCLIVCQAVIYVTFIAHLVLFDILTGKEEWWKGSFRFSVNLSQ